MNEFNVSFSSSAPLQYTIKFQLGILRNNWITVLGEAEAKVKAVEKATLRQAVATIVFTATTEEELTYLYEYELDPKVGYVPYL